MGGNYSISQSANADSSLYQREPVLRFVWVVDLYRKSSLNNLKRGDQWSPLRYIRDLF